MIDMDSKTKAGIKKALKEINSSLTGFRGSFGIIEAKETLEKLLKKK